MNLIPTSLLLFALAAAPAEEVKGEPAARAKAVAPFLDAQTFALVRLDLTRTDADAVITKIAGLAKLEPKELAEMTKGLTGHVKALAKAGAKDLYFVYSLANESMEQPVVIVPAAAGADAKAIAEELRRGILPEVIQIGQTVLGGPKPAVARIKEGKLAVRAELGRAFAAAGEAQIQMLLLPPAELRRALEETIPAVPREVGGAATKTFTRGVEWVAVGADVTPKLAARAVIQAPDADAAKALAAALAPVLGAVSQDRGVKKAVPNVEQVVAALKPQLADDRLTFSLGEEEIAGLIRPLMGQAAKARQSQALNQLRQIGLALHVYHDVYGALPTQASLDKQGKPLLSWRVHILPYIEQEALYKEFKLDEPWDSEHNTKLIARMPKLYQGREAKLNEAGKTVFLTPLTDGAALARGPKGVTLQAITAVDGTSNTIGVVEADDDQAVIWTKPDDLAVDAKQPRKGLGGRYDGAFLAMYLDGSVGVVPRETPDQTVYLLFRYNSGKVKQRP